MRTTCGTEGLRLLRAWMNADPATRTQSYVARSVGVSQPSVSGWLGEKSRPEPHHRTALRALAGVDESSWLTDEERTHLADALGRIEATSTPTEAA